MYIDFDILKRYSEEDNSLRSYQQKNKQKIYDAWSKGLSVLLQMPTGTGKTRTFVSIIKDISHYSREINEALSTLILVHRTELIDQIDKELGSKYDLDHGIIQAGTKEQTYYPIQLASVQTLSRRLDSWGNREFNFIIVDEAHHITAASYQKIIKSFPSANILGVTATPVRLNGEGFKGTFNELIVSPSVKDFINKGWLCQYDYYSVARSSFIQKEIDGIKKYSHGDYSEKEMERVCDNDKIRAQVVQAYLDFANRKKGIVYTINKKHNKKLCEQFISNGIKAIAIDSDTPKEIREDCIEQFRRGDVSIICNVNLFTEGFDCPDIEFIQLARPTKSLALFLQQVGRGLRISENKEKTIFLDNVGLYNRFGFPSSKRMWRCHFNGKELNDLELDNIEDADNELLDETPKRNQNTEEGHEKVILIQSSEDKAYLEKRTNQLWDFLCEYNNIIIKPYNEIIRENGLSGIVKVTHMSKEEVGSYKLVFKDIEELSKMSGKNNRVRYFGIYKERYKNFEIATQTNLYKEKRKNAKYVSALKSKIRVANFSYADLMDILPNIIDNKMPKTPKCYEGRPLTVGQLIDSILINDRKDGKQISTFGKRVIETGLFNETVVKIEKIEEEVNKFLEHYYNEMKK